MRVNVSAEINLSDIDDRDLMDEVNRRKAPPKKSVVSLGDIIKVLQILGCPERIMEDLTLWANESEPNALKLRDWIAWAER